jgi:hypothetical protein
VLNRMRGRYMADGVVDDTVVPSRDHSVPQTDKIKRFLRRRPYKDQTRGSAARYKTLITSRNDYYDKRNVVHTTCEGYKETNSTTWNHFDINN